MKLNRNLFLNKEYVLEGDIDFSDVAFDPYHIRKIENTHVKIKGNLYDELLILNVDIVTDVVGVSAYSLKDVPLHLHIKDNLEISSEESDSEDLFYEPDLIFDIDPYILSIIVSEVPNKFTLKGEELPKSGEGYRLLSEEEYEEEQKTKKDSRWAALDDIELD